MNERDIHMRVADASAAGLILIELPDGGTRWEFGTAGVANVATTTQVLRPQQTACGVGLHAPRSFAVGHLLLAERWLVGIPLAGSKNACEQCLRVCAWSPVNTDCSMGCGARYCSETCRADAWRQHHCLLCTAQSSDIAASGGAPLQVKAHPLAVFIKHARMAPSVLQQKPEEILLAARMMAMIALHDAAAPAATTGAFAPERNASRSVVPAPFDQLSSYCVVGAARAAVSGHQMVSAAGATHGPGGQDASLFATRSKWLGDSYRLLAASALGRHPSFRSHCPPHVYSHCLGLIDRNGASASALSAASVHAARAAAKVGSIAAAAAVTSSRGGGMVEGIGIYPTFSFANHSCEPNAVNAKGPRDGDAAMDCSLVLRACKPIEAGEEIVFDYLDTAHDSAASSSGCASQPSASERRARLQEHFGFLCECPACSSSR